MKTLVIMVVLVVTGIAFAKDTKEERCRQSGSRMVCDITYRENGRVVKRETRTCRQVGNRVVCDTKER